MVFGEIVEPSTRALLDEEDDNTPEIKDIEWKTAFKIPESINTLLISESIFANRILKLACLDSVPSLNETLLGELRIYKKSDDYIVLANPSPDCSIGELTENLLALIEKSINVFAITTAPIASYQKNNNSDITDSFIRMLSTTKDDSYRFLEMPNLITGLGANILSYCNHTNRACSLYICYVDQCPIDSINSKPIIDLLQKINMKPVKNVILEEQLPSSNLYM